MRIRFYQEASDELENALDWYGERSPDAERGFAKAVEDALAKIVKTPERFLRLIRVLI